MEKKGIPDTLEKHQLTLGDLGLKGCTLYYRRRKIDMPLAEMPAGVTEERRAKVEKVRAKIVDRAQSKFLFQFQERTVPKELIVEGDKLVGLRCARTEVVDGRAQEQAGSEFELRAPLFVSSIGSVPEPLPDVATKGEYYRFSDWDTGALEQFDNVYGLGNVVTGKGNIRVSRKHGAFVAKHLLEEVLTNRAPLDASAQSALRDRIAARQTEVGYDGDFESWVKLPELA